MARPSCRCLYIVMLVAWIAPGVSAQVPGRNPVSRADRENRFVPPIAISKQKNGIVEVSLEMRFETVEVERLIVENGKPKIVKDKLKVRTLKSPGDPAGNMIAQEIRVKAGQTLKIKLSNVIDPKLPDEPIVHNQPGGFNRTNLHTHGLHVSPKGNSDNVFLELKPGDPPLEYVYEIRDDHVAGTMWFHAHRHGSTALQLASGMAGALIVDPGPKGGIDDVKEIAAAMAHQREKILVFQQLTYHLEKDPVTGEDYGVVGKDDVYAPDLKKTIEVDLINGAFQPLFEMKRGEIQRWRCVHGGLSSELNLAVVKRDPATNTALLDATPWTLHEMAADGIPFKAIHTPKNIWLYPGYRSDFLLQAPAEDGEYALVHLPSEPGKAFRKRSKLSETPRVLAHISVKGDGPKMELPTTTSIRKYAPEDIETVDNAEPRQLHFDTTLGNQINGEEFDPSKTPIEVVRGTAEEWLLVADGDRHPFHIHVNPFQVILEKDAKGNIRRSIWRDTYFIHQGGPKVTIRMRFEHFDGKSVLHCHNLRHEDQGMMMAFCIKPNAKEGCEPKGKVILPRPAPAWALKDVEGRLRRQQEMDGVTHLIVFYRGPGCDHCRKQLEALASKAADFDREKVRVVTIAPESADSLKSELTGDDLRRLGPLTLLVDPKVEVFQRFGCVLDQTPMHGVFVVDASGQIRWQHISESPYMAVNELLERLRAVRRR